MKKYKITLNIDIKKNINIGVAKLPLALYKNRYTKVYNNNFIHLEITYVSNNTKNLNVMLYTPIMIEDKCVLLEDLILNELSMYITSK